MLEILLALAIAFAEPWNPDAFEHAEHYFVPVMHFVQVILSVQNANARAWRIWLFVTSVIDCVSVAWALHDVIHKYDTPRIGMVLALGTLLVVCDTSRYAVSVSPDDDDDDVHTLITGKQPGTAAMSKLGAFPSRQSYNQVAKKSKSSFNDAPTV